MNIRDFMNRMNRAAGAVYILFHPACRRQRIGNPVFDGIQQVIERDIGWRKTYCRTFAVLVSDAMYMDMHKLEGAFKIHMPDLGRIEVMRSEKIFGWLVRGVVAK